MGDNYGAGARETPLSARALLIRDLMHLRDDAGLPTGSVVRVRDGSRSEDPFGPGYVAHIDTRADLKRRLASLDPRSRTLLYLWYVEERPVTEIAARLGCSRVHCYRLRERAFDALLRPALEASATAG